MFEIKLFLRRHWEETAQATPANNYFPLSDTASVRELLARSPANFYHYGKVVLGTAHQTLVDAECELDYFISCLQEEQPAIFSGKPHVVNNSYFKLAFLYHNKLTITANAKTLVVKKQEFRAAFREAAEQYYKLLADFKADAAYYRGQAQQVHDQWQ